MDTDGDASVNNIDKSESKTKANTVYFGVFIPYDNSKQPNVFEDKDAALKIAKKFKKSRFKAFQFYHEAVEFSYNGAEHPNNTVSIDGIEGEKKENSSAGEKASPFRTPRPQELIEFRNKIEHGNLISIQEMIEYNPRYLVSSGDTPSILQEGARLNALHVAAKERNAAVVELILNTISNPDFIKKLYGDDNQENAEQRCKMLLDLYLNTPTKGANDTPLHMASKWGAEKVVEVLLSYPECDKTRRNKFNFLAEEVACERTCRVPYGVKERIQKLLCDNYYVPVLRTEDNSMPPLVGEPFSPSSPPTLNKDPLSPRLEIHAYAGPMERKEAESFRKVWKTPPRSLNLNSPLGKKTLSDNLSSIRLKDPEKGLERIGNQLANNYNVSWKEYWEFLDCFIDISSDEGLNILEKHLQNKMHEYQEAFEVFSPLPHKIEDTPPIDTKQTCHPLVYVDKACQVFACRVVSNVSSVLSSTECAYVGIARNSETDVKLLELLMSSYMEDERFTEWVNFQKVHSRLANLVARKLIDSSSKDCKRLQFVSKLDGFLENIVKRSDYFSSDDEGPHGKEAINKPTVYRKQVVCLWSRIKNELDSGQIYSDSQVEEPQIVNAWDLFDACNCIFHPKKPKRNNLSRNSSLKNHSKSRKYHLQGISKKLTFGDDSLNSSNVSDTNGDIGLGFSDSSKSDTEDEFFTPPSSPSKLNADSDSKEEYSDAESPKLEVFLEGAHPTKTDCAVYNALQFAKCKIDEKTNPLVYKWNHSISLYSAAERESWPIPHKPTSHLLDQDEPQSPLAHKPSWLRVTGTNSPKAAIKSYSYHH
ncbi:ankyrin repeat and LEM domain-containing protein 2 isoform X2 [Sitophilus oryzae]|uniref:Ankyrin repeat and LEM domain-containing protein 2 isoform X2 n=1 Tax=Sitophilus oryzae TaxID=7048 RepID=A0A6J2XGI2_SITOR|nr:ankyrin repeat and LEM domain-containing protein 2 isoform X2 [Sitophilus oryzae]